MPFKPLTKTALAKKPTLSAEDSAAEAEVAAFQTPAEIIETTTERIRIIFDDSGSMGSFVTDEQGKSKPASELAAEGTIDYMKSCTPKSTAIGIAFLNAPALPLTRNIPKLAPEVKAMAANGGGTPLFGALRNLVQAQPIHKYTRALIFTDGQATDGYSFDIVKLMGDVQELGIPIDLILIGNFTVASLSPDHRTLKNLCETTKGTFLICKDGAIFKAKLKYFAPPLRYMLPQIASKET
ncbi:MAG TPA: vWA domain-containing protein [Candidatus Saccharimonadales bacterium]|jgi:hypothetical protein